MGLRGPMLAVWLAVTGCSEGVPRGARAAEGTTARGATPPVRVVAAHHAGRLAAPAASRARRAAVSWLLQHPDAAHPALAAVLESQTSGWREVPGLIAQMGRPDGVPVLRGALLGDTGSGERAWLAGVALGRHPDPGAARALEAGLDSRDAQVVKAALRGLEQLRDPQACRRVVALAGHGDAGVRLSSLVTSQQLACLQADQLDALSQDPDAAVRGLARRLRAARQGGPVAAR